MRELNARQNPIIVGTATIAADLHRIMHIAWTVSLAAKNARIISAQAGEKARGFQPITRYIDEITQSTLGSTEKVEQESVHLTRFASHYLQILDSDSRYRRIFRDAAEAAHIESLRPAADACAARLSDGQRQVGHHLRVLKLYLEELNENMRAALAVAAICRIEASRAGEFRENLSVVADDLEQAARSIQEMLQNGLKRIDIIQDETRFLTGQAQ
jgi:hypothetical protein